MGLKENTMSIDLKNPVEMADHELIAEWEDTDLDAADAARSDALAAEMERRNLDF